MDSDHYRPGSSEQAQHSQYRGLEDTERTLPQGSNTSQSQTDDHNQSSSPPPPQMHSYEHFSDPVWQFPQSNMLSSQALPPPRSPISTTPPTPQALQLPLPDISPPPNDHYPLLSPPPPAYSTDADSPSPPAAPDPVQVVYAGMTAEELQAEDAELEALRWEWSLWAARLRWRNDIVDMYDSDNTDNVDDTFFAYHMGNVVADETTETDEDMDDQASEPEETPSRGSTSPPSPMTPAAPEADVVPEIAASSMSPSSSLSPPPPTLPTSASADEPRGGQKRKASESPAEQRPAQLAKGGETGPL